MLFILLDNGKIKMALCVRYSQQRTSTYWNDDGYMAPTILDLLHRFTTKDNNNNNKYHHQTEAIVEAYGLV
jgi:hypothetical protein